MFTLHLPARRFYFASPVPFHIHKYAHKLQQKAAENGLDIEQLKARAREESRRKQKDETAAHLASFKNADTGSSHIKPSIRKDSSPVKPLSSILNLSKLLATPHAPSQISALWTAYHASRTKGTGRGYVCASLPLDSYNAMARVARKFPVFVLPVPRKSSQDPSASENTGPAHEFFFLQWDFHPAPPVPSITDSNPFEPASSSNLAEPSTVLFAPLQEYKLRTSYATPYLVLTFYTDISQSHGIVLLRGEITPSPSSVAAHPEGGTPERFLLSQVDAQLLAMGLQRFYLWEERKEGGHHNPSPESLLRQFHEEPDKFSWQDLLKSSVVIP